MDQAMVVIVFLLGIALVIVAVIALFRGLRGEQAELNLLGNKVSGTGGALFLVVGVLLLFTSKGWSDTLGRKDELARAVVGYQGALSTLQKQSAALQARVPASSLIALRQQSPQLFLQAKVILPPKAMLEVQRVRLRP